MVDHLFGCAWCPPTVPGPRTLTWREERGERREERGECPELEVWPTHPTSSAASRRPRASARASPQTRSPAPPATCHPPRRRRRLIPPCSPRGVIRPSCWRTVYICRVDNEALTAGAGSRSRGGLRGRLLLHASDAGVAMHDLLRRAFHLAVGETVILLTSPLPVAGVYGMVVTVALLTLSLHRY